MEDNSQSTNSFNGIKTEQHGDALSSNRLGLKIKEMVDPTDCKSFDILDDATGDKSTDTADDPTSVKSTDTVDDPTGDKSTDTADDPTGDKSTDTVDDPTGDKSTDTVDDPTNYKSTDIVDDPTSVKSTDTVDDPTGNKSTDTVDDPTGDKSTEAVDGPNGNKSTDTVDDPTNYKSTDTVDYPTSDKSTETADDPVDDKTVTRNELESNNPDEHLEEVVPSGIQNEHTEHDDGSKKLNEKQNTTCELINNASDTDEPSHYNEKDVFISKSKTKLNQELSGYPKRKWSPKRDAFIFSKYISYFWKTGLFVKGSKVTLEEDDIEGIMPKECLHPLTEKLERNWRYAAYSKDGSIKEETSLNSVLLKTFGWEFFFLGILPFLNEVFKIVQPLLVGLLVEYFTVGSSMGQGKAVGFALAISLSYFIGSWINNAYNNEKRLFGVRLRIALTGLVYKKILVATPQALSRITTGYIMNLISTDCQRIELAALLAHFVVIGPIEFVLMSYLLYKELGPSSLAGISMLLLLSPTQIAMAKAHSWCRKKVMKWRDQRVGLMNEIISGMKVIKLYTWENIFTKQVNKVRRKEMTSIKQLSWFRSFIMSFFMSSGSLVSFVTFTAYVLAGNQLTAKKVFTVLGLFNVARMMFLMGFPVGVMFLMESVIASNRIKKFLIEDEIKKSRSENVLQPKYGNTEIKVENLSASWSEDDAESLKGISLTVKHNELVAVVGSVGSGKSSLLMAILGELRASKGNVSVKGKVAFVSQEPWLISGTIRSNITFGNEFDKDRFNKILTVCGLVKDLELLPLGDKTLVGERGVTLSGGQKARVNLARAVYSDADIYLFDDPLSAVDAQVGRHLYDECINGYLSNTTRVLVTHQLQYLSNVNNIIALNGGQCVGQGSLEVLGLDNLNIDQHAVQYDDTDPIDSLLYKRTLSALSSTSSHNNMYKSSPENISSGLNLTEHAMFESQEESDQIDRETKQEGSITGEVYKRFFLAGYSVVVWILVTFLFMLSQVVYVMADWWLSYWSSQEETHSSSSERHRDLGIYALLTVLTVVLGFTRALVSFHVILKATENIHMSMFTALMRAPMYFFDTNSIGRIINRFSKDTSLIDDMISFSLFEVAAGVFMILSVLILVTANMAIILALILPVVVIGTWTRFYYIKTAREVKRIENVARSPVYGHLSTTILGIASIRSYRIQEKFFDILADLQDAHSQAHISYVTCGSWLQFNLDLLCGLFITFSCIVPIIFADQFTASTVGLLLIYALRVPQSLQRLLLQSSDLENQFTSVERVIEYCDLPSEAPLKSKVKPEDEWPRRGSITLTNVNFKYHPKLPQVLRNVSFHIKSKQKIGICGRTGAGKSSLLSTLFRTAEPHGLITIDGLDIQKIGLKHLRRKISIIPQDPIIFSGSLRKNIDPFNEHSDEALWDVLEECAGDFYTMMSSIKFASTDHVADDCVKEVADVRLKEAVNEFSNKLETLMQEGGGNLSVGQRQLVCLARVVLKNNQVLVIDEATANVDLNTDNLIQETIREKFKHCTVLTIAHRLQTIIDSDKVMVLDAGQLKEFDKPYKLLRCKNSIFYSLVKETGEEDKLFNIAYKSYRRKKIEGGESENDMRKGKLGACVKKCRCKRKRDSSIDEAKTEPQ